MRRPFTNESEPDGPVTWEHVAALQEELKRTARAMLAREGNAGSVHTTQLLNSAFKKLAPKARDWREVSWADREAFFKDAFHMMRRVLIDYARRRKVRAVVKVGGFESELLAPLIEAGALPWERLATPETSEQAEALGLGLEALERDYPQLAAVIQHWYFDELTQSDIGRMLGVTERTVRNRLALALTTLAEFIRRQAPLSAPKVP